MDEFEQFQRLAGDVARKKQRSGSPALSWSADSGLTITGWLVDREPSRRNSKYKSHHDWCDDWLDVEYILSTDGKVYLYRYWMYEDDHTPKDTGSTLEEMSASQLVGAQGTPFSSWSRKIKRMQWK